MTGDSGSVVHLVSEILSLTSGNGDKLADEVGVSYASLYAWSRGRRRPTAKNLRALAAVARRRARRLSALADRLGASEEGKADGASRDVPLPGGATARGRDGVAEEVRAPSSRPELSTRRDTGTRTPQGQRL